MEKETDIEEQQITSSFTIDELIDQINERKRQKEMEEHRLLQEKHQHDARPTLTEEERKMMNCFILIIFGVIWNALVCICCTPLVIAFGFFMLYPF